MTATEAQVAAARRALDALGVELPWVATRAAADAVVAAGPDPATIAADEWRTAQNVNHLRATIRTGWPALAKALNDWHEAQS